MATPYYDEFGRYIDEHGQVYGSGTQRASLPVGARTGALNPGDIWSPTRIAAAGYDMFKSGTSADAFAWNGTQFVPQSEYTPESTQTEPSMIGLLGPPQQQPQYISGQPVGSTATQQSTQQQQSTQAANTTEQNRARQIASGGSSVAAAAPAPLGMGGGGGDTGLSGLLGRGGAAEQAFGESELRGDIGQRMPPSYQALFGGARRIY